MITEAEYRKYIHDFNAACAGDGTGFGAFFDRYFEPEAVFEYLPNATKNIGRAMTVEFWQGVHDRMEEAIRNHASFLSVGTTVATEAPIDFRCKKDLEWVGIAHKAGSSFRLRMAGFYDVGASGKFSYVRVYSVYHPAYQVA